MRNKLAISVARVSKMKNTEMLAKGIRKRRKNFIDLKGDVSYEQIL